MGVGFTPTTLVTGNLVDKVEANSDRVKFQTKGPTDVRVQKIEIAAGGYSGWHHHSGVVIVTVASGAVTFTHSDCSSTTYGRAFRPERCSSRAAMFRRKPRALPGRGSMRRSSRRTPIRPSSGSRTPCSLARDPLTRTFASL